MARGDKKDLFFRKLRSAGLSKPAVQTLAERLDALEAADSAASGGSETLVVQLWQDGFISSNIHVTIDPTVSVADPLTGKAGACRQLLLPPVAIASGGICGVSLANNGTADVVVANLDLAVSNMTGTETFEATATNVTAAAGVWAGVDLVGSALSGTHLSWDAGSQAVVTDAADVFWGQLLVQIAPNP